MRNEIQNSVKSIDLEKIQNKHIYEWGTKHGEENPKDETNRTDFRRQRDRILYTGGFRRLQDKTQVIAATKSGDHRTRLTHSLEVEQIATSLSDALGLNRDLVAAIALGHDVGHTPFGHAVERFLDEKLKEKGGFSHAVQSVRYLSQRKIPLSNEVFEGILKHDTDIYSGAYDERQFDCSKYNPLEPGNLEAQVVYWADKLAYLTHDFEDFYKTEIYKNASQNDIELEPRLKDTLAKLIPEKKDEILKDIESFETRDLIRNVLSNLRDESLNTLNGLEELDPLNLDKIKEKTKERILKHESLEYERLEINKIERKILGIEKSLESDNNKKNEIKRMKDEIKEMKDEMKRLKGEIKKKKKAAYQNGLIINFEDEYREGYYELRMILDDYYIFSPEVQRSDAKAIKVVELLYEEFIRNSKILPLNIQKLIKEDENEKERLVADYIASMTDRYAEEVYNNLNSIGSYYKY